MIGTMKHKLLDMLKDIWMYVRQVVYILNCQWIRLRYRVVHNKSIRNPLYPIWVDPSQIIHVVAGGVLPTSSPFCLDRSIGGDWDMHIARTQRSVGDLGDQEQGLILIEDTDIHQAFSSHFNNQVPWEDTDFYKRVVGQIKQGKRKWRCSTAEEFDQRLQDVDKLFNTIREQGYKTQLELHTPRTWDEIRLAIGRSGELILFDGRHRLSIAKILELKRIPAIVSIRHSQWDGDLETIQQLYGNH